MAVAEAPSTSVLLDAADVDKLGLERSAADEETVNVSGRAEVGCVLAVDGAAVDDACGVGDALRDTLGEPRTRVLVDGLGLVLGRDLACADGPDGLVRNDDLGPVALADDRGDGLELALDNVVGHVLLALLERLADTGNDLETARKRGLDLLGDDLVRVAEERAALRVAEDDPGDAGVLELLGRDLASERARVLGERVLRSNLDGLLDRADNVEEVQRGRGNHDLWV